jgi:hypothetical protein
MIAAQAFPLGALYNQINHRINPIINAPIPKNIPKIVIKRINQIILKTKATTATVLLLSLSSKVGVKCSSLILKNNKNKITNLNIYV